MEQERNRRCFLTATVGGFAASLAGCTQSFDQSNEQETAETITTTSSDSTTEASTESGQIPDEIGLESLSGAFDTPVDIEFVPDADLRYIADQKGSIRIHEADGVRDEPLIDFGDSVFVGAEAGVLGIALHPNFSETRRLFVRYSAPSRSGTPDDYSHTFVLSEFEVSEDGLTVDRDSEQSILEIPQPNERHNSGALVFGPDDYLYVGTGDGTSGSDQGLGAASDWYDDVEGGNGQDVTENLLGSILRINVDGEQDDKPYAIPNDNPLVGQEGLDEHFAWGFRNPFRMAFDNGDLYVGDVGEASYEEINRVEKGGNYGWNVKEATHCFEADDCPDETPESVRGGEPLIDPVIEYPHSGEGVSGNAVIAGQFYRGSTMPGMQGIYLFADWNAQGRIFAAKPEGDDGLWSTEVVDIAEADVDKLDNRAFAFGRDSDGEIYVLGSGSWSGGSVHRIVPPDN